MQTIKEKQRLSHNAQINLQNEFQYLQINNSKKQET